MEVPDSIKVNLLARQQENNGSPLFGELTVIGYGGRIKNSTIWICRCSCGKEKPYLHGNLQQDKSTRCVACQRIHVGKLKETHGRSNTKTYRSWNIMKRNGTCVKEWIDFQIFYKDMRDKPFGLCLCRHETGELHGPGNSYWGTIEELDRTKSGARLIEADGVVRTISQWAKHLGVSKEAIYIRLANGWDEYKAVTTPKLSPTESAVEEKYKYSDWFDSKVHVLIGGVDFFGSIESFYSTLVGAANKRGLRLSYRCMENVVLLKTEPRKFLSIEK